VFFKKPPVIFAIQGTVSDVDTKEPIVGASVKLIGTDGTSVELETDQTGFYIFADKDGSDERYVQEGTSYTIFVSKKGYLNSKGQETTVGIEKSTAFVHDFLLQSIKAKEISFPKVEYDLGSYKLRPASKDSLDFLYQTLVDNPNIVIELAAHTDARGSDESNDLLSQQRAQSCVDYLISKGIEAARMNAKGYGEHSPYSGNYNGQQVTLTEEYINGLPKNEQEAAHQTNRRTVFSVLRDDFVPANSGGNDGDTGTEGDQE
jgi:peptidoglycan-associated lipoprotein